jgi:diaminohydroxyphosphoribosylaminopyrimidine deaminase / 5-amino-6-(5-phosphoribosylamino)uracil reductase
MPVENDEQFLRRAMRLAMKGRGQVEPNPMVGCVIVKGEHVIGEGYHRKFGEAHAEPNALESCTESPEGATAFVTLEPCCHVDKQTPPCVPRLIDAKLARVVIGCLDPNPQVNGQGAQELREAGIQVDQGVLEYECKQLIAPFLARVAHERPYITLKWAQTANGKIGGANKTWLRISNKTSGRVVHELRARCDAILVGIGTVLADDPMLIPRGVRQTRPSVRYILDRNLRIPLGSRLVQTAREFPVVVACSAQAIRTAKAAQLEKLGIHLLPASELGQVSAGLFARGATHVLVEPGPTLAQSFFDENRADRLWIFQSAKSVDDPSATAAAGVPDHFVQTGRCELNGDVLTEYLNPRSHVFFSKEASADFVLSSDAGGAR